MALKPKFRPATLSDASSFAVLIDIAGNGLPNKTWFDHVDPRHSALEEGRQVVRRNEGEDYYRNTTVALIGTEIAACLIGGLPENLYDLSRIDKKPALFRPVARLAAQAVGTWYVDVMASFSEFLGQGLGTKLLELAASKAEEIGAPATSIVVGSWNDGAARLYGRSGYRPAGRARASLPTGFPKAGDWVLMTRPLT